MILAAIVTYAQLPNRAVAALVIFTATWLRSGVLDLIPEPASRRARCTDDLPDRRLGDINGRLGIEAADSSDRLLTQLVPNSTPTSPKPLPEFADHADQPLVEPLRHLDRDLAWYGAIECLCNASGYTCQCVCITAE
jgi:hypothetical protein